MALFLACSGLGPAPFVRAESIDLEPSKDNTLYSQGELSNGSGSHFFAGRAGSGSGNGARRRALIQFLVQGNVPDGAVIESVSMQLRVSKTPSSTSRTVSLHRLTKEWGEGTANAPGNEGRGTAASSSDATWTKTGISGLNWSSSGADFLPSASASLPVGGTASYTWNSSTSPDLIADVQGWLDGTIDNYGWLLKGDESTVRTAKRFDSSENSTTSNRPKLTIEYTLPTHREQWGTQFFGSGATVDDSADGDHDGLRNLLEYAFDRDPGQPESGVLPVPVINAEGKLAIDFTRDTRATDLTYRVEATGTPEDSNSWTALAESAAGAATSGSGGVTETGSSDTRTVIVSDSSLADSHVRRFFRLVVERTE